MIPQPSPDATLEQPSAQRLAVAVIAFGVALRLFQLGSGPSFWLDELAVVRNMVHLPLSRLASGALEYGQMAPVGFLAVGGLLSSLVPDQDWVFRLAPLASSILTLPLIFLMGRQLLGPFPALAATALVAVSPPMIGLSSVAKQYAGDAFVSAALMYGGFRVFSGQVSHPRELFRLGTGGALLLLFSFPGVLVAFGLAIAVSGRLIAGSRSGWVQRVVAFGAPLGLAAALVSAIAVGGPSDDTAQYMAQFWAAGFPPSSPEAPEWLWTQFSEIYDAAFFTPYPLTGFAAFWPDVLLGFGLIGMLGLLRGGGDAAIVTLTPVAVAVVAAALHLYPLAGRPSIFLVPTLALLTVSGGVTIGRLVGRVFEPAGPIAYSATAVPVVLMVITSPPPYTFEHTRPMLEELAAERQSTDVVYSYYGANHALDYYGERVGITDWQPGTCSRGDPRRYLEELDAFRGRPRVWVVFTHVLPPYSEARVILGYLRTIGSERKAILAHQDIRMTSAFLFDLSDATRLDRASVRNYLPRSRVAVDTRLTCGLSPMWEWERPIR